MDFGGKPTKFMYYLYIFSMCKLPMFSEVQFLDVKISISGSILLDFEILNLTTE